MEDGREEFEKEKATGILNVKRELLKLEKKAPVFLAFVAIFDWEIADDGKGQGPGTGEVIGMHPKAATPHLVLALQKLQEHLLSEQISHEGGMIFGSNEE